jgi:hypothetical protein
VPYGQPVAAVLRRGRRIVAGDVPGGHLLLEPLAGVPGGDAAVGGDLGLGGRPEVSERLVESEFQAQVDAERLKRVGHVIDQPLGEHLARVDVGTGWHGSSFAAAAPRCGPLLHAAWSRSRTDRVRLAYAGCTRPCPRLADLEGLPSGSLFGGMSRHGAERNSFRPITRFTL